FQDMAVAYGYSLLRDLQAAEDASQEAFLEAFRDLAKLRQPEAFPGWFRRIVFKQCDRLRRRKGVPTGPLQLLGDQAREAVDPVDELEQREWQDQILRAIDTLPEHERETVLLYYMSGYSHQEVGKFLNVPVSTVKKRLHSARGRLRERLLLAVEDG